MLMKSQIAIWNYETRWVKTVRYQLLGSSLCDEPHAQPHQETNMRHFSPWHSTAPVTVLCMWEYYYYDHSLVLYFHVLITKKF